MDNGDTSAVKQDENRKPGTWLPGQSGNPNGRPPKGNSLTELMREFLDTVPPGQSLSYKEAFIRKVYKLAMEDGSDASIRLIWNYIDGMPHQKSEVDVTTKGKPLTNSLLSALYVSNNNGPSEAEEAHQED